MSPGADSPRDGATGRRAAGPDPADPEAEEITRKARRKQAAQARHERSAWYGLGMFGLVGWAVAVPTLAGAALGLWLDSGGGSGRSWTLALLLAGVALGCLNAWYWVSRESGGD